MLYILSRQLDNKGKKNVIRKGVVVEELLQFMDSSGVSEFDPGGCRAISSALLKLFLKNKQIPDNNHHYFSFSQCHFHMTCLNQPVIRER